MQEYTISEVAKKLGIEKSRIKRLIKIGKIIATKGKDARSAYRINETEVLKIRDLLGQKISPTQAEAPAKMAVIPQGESVATDRHYEDILHMQKLLVETMRDLAATQEQIAATLRELVKKV